MSQLGSTIIVIATTVVACSGENDSGVAAAASGSSGRIVAQGFGGAFVTASATVASASGAGGFGGGAAALPVCESLHTPKGSMSGPCECSTIQDHYLVYLTHALLDAYQSTGRLCAADDATQIPFGRVPSKNAYQPLSTPGSDFMSGTPARGWSCIGFMTNFPLCVQLNYRQGSGYLSTKFGNLDPGPNGFELSAISDYDGDGELGVEAITGHVEPGSNKVVIEPIFRFQPSE